mgnify:CR=1 FL=1
MIKLSTNQRFKENTNEKHISIDKTSDEFKTAEIVWLKFIELLKQNLTETEIDTWFSIIVPKSFEENVLTVYVPSKDYYSIIEKRFNKQISGIIESGLLGESGVLQYEINETSYENDNYYSEPDDELNSTKNNQIHKIEDFPGLNEKSNNVFKIGAEHTFASNLYPKYTFDGFVKGESNELALAAAYAIANNPGKLYNPFFVYGGVGIGKTHLTQSIGNEILKRFPDKKVYYTTAPDFTTSFTSSIARDRVDFSGASGTKQLDSFYKSLDVLIIDDIQNLAGKIGTQDFMYQIFNTLYNNKKHIIFSCDKPISQIKDIEERLISRFKSGMVADIQTPSWEMRVAIIKRKLEESGIDVSEEVIHYIATNVKDSIRTIEGIIVGMIAESTLIYKGEINMDIAEKVVQRTVGYIRKSKTISIENIIYSVASYYKLSENSILSKKRTKDVAFARQIAMYLAKELTNSTLETIGLNFGGKDHATVLYSCNSIKEQIKNNKEVASQVEDIKEQINLL